MTCSRAGPAGHRTPTDAVNFDYPAVLSASVLSAWRVAPPGEPMTIPSHEPGADSRSGRTFEPLSLNALRTPIPHPAHISDQVVDDLR